MISLKKREHFSANPLEVDASNGVKNPDRSLSGGIFLAFFVLSFCVRYCQASLFASVQYSPPDQSWFAPNVALILLPAACASVFAGWIANKTGKNQFTNCLILMSIGLASLSILLQAQILPGLIVAIAIAFLACGLEVGRIGAWTKIALLTPSRQANFFIVLLILTELAATAFGINCFKQISSILPIVQAMRIASLLYAGGFLLTASEEIIALRNNAEGLQYRPADRFEKSFSQTDLDDARTILQKFHSFASIFPLNSIALASATNSVIVTLFCLALTGKVVSNISIIALLSSTAMGLLFGSLYCLIPVRNLQISRTIVAIFLSTVGCLLSAYKPFGQILFFGLFLTGFAATLASFSSFAQILAARKLRTTSAPSLAIGGQVALCYLSGFAVALVIEPRIDSLSAAVFIRLLSISQIVALLLAGLFSFTIVKFRRVLG